MKRIIFKLANGHLSMMRGYPQCMATYINAEGAWTESNGQPDELIYPHTDEIPADAPETEQEYLWRAKRKAFEGENPAYPISLAVEEAEIEEDDFQAIRCDQLGIEHLDIINGEVVVSLPNARLARAKQIYIVRDKRVLELAQEIVNSIADGNDTITASLRAERDALIALESTLDLSGLTTIDEIKDYLPPELV